MLPLISTFFQVRVTLIYHAHFHSIYLDILAFSLSTADPFVHPVTCLLVSQRYRQGYKAAMKNILSMLCKWTCGYGSASKVHPHSALSLKSGVNQLDNHSRNLGSLNHSIKINERTQMRNNATSNFLQLEVIVEAVETQH